MNRRRAFPAAAAAIVLSLAGLLPAASRVAHAAPDGGSEIVQIIPPSPVQGDTIAVSVAAPASSGVAVRFDGTAVRTYALPDGSRRALIGTDPNTGPAHTIAVTITAAGGPPTTVARAVRVGSGRFEIRTLTLPPAVFGLITPQNAAIERRALAQVLSRRTPEALWSGAFVAPSAGVMDSPYGYQSVYNGHREWWHQGTDFSAAEGDPVVAANSGVVALAQKLPLGGNTVVIDHGQGVLSEYLHLSAFTVQPGARVNRGELIGRIGATGLVTGPSLHWGLYVNGTWVNPLFWTARRSGLTR